MAAIKENEEVAACLQAEQEKIAILKQQVAQLNLQRRRVQDHKEELTKLLHESKNQLKHA